MISKPFASLRVNASAAAADKFFGTTIPIFILENIKVPGVVPEDPVFVEVERLILSGMSD